MRRYTVPPDVRLPSILSSTTVSRNTRSPSSLVKLRFSGSYTHSPVPMTISLCLGSAGNGEEAFPVSCRFRPCGGGDFQGIVGYRPMTLLPACEQRESQEPGRRSQSRRISPSAFTARFLPKKSRQDGL